MTTQMIPVLGFAPDVDPSTPGALQNCENLLPTLIGMRASPSPVNAGLVALAQPAAGSALIQRLDGTDRQLVGTVNHLYENVSGAWVDQSKTGGYSIGTSGQWRFAVFGQESLAVNGTNKIQQSQDGVFTDIPVAIQSITITNVGSAYTSAPTVTISLPDVVTGTRATATATLNGSTIGSITITNYGSGYLNNPTVSFSGGGGSSAAATATIVPVPVGSLIAVCQGQVFVANLSAPPGQTADSWFCSGIYDQTQWNPNDETLCAFGQIVDTPGSITAMKPIGNNMIIYKSNSMFLGTNEGPPIIWGFTGITRNIGVSCQEAVVSIGSAHYFIGNDNFYVYQLGWLPQPIGDNVKQWFFNNWNPSFRYVISSFYDQQNAIVYWAYVSNASTSGTIDSCICYNWKSQKWGKMDIPMQGFVQIVSGQITYAELGIEWSEWEDLPAISYNSPFWINFSINPGYIDTTNTMQALVGAANTSSFTTNYLGDDVSYSRLQTLKLRFKTLPHTTTGTAVWHGVANLGEFDSTQVWIQNTGAMHDNKFDVDTSARWHTINASMIGDYELIGYAPVLIEQGKQ